MEELTQVIDEKGTVLTYEDENGQYQLSKTLANTTDKINKLQLNMKKKPVSYCQNTFRYQNRGCEKSWV